MKLEVVVHDAREAGYWAEVPAIPGCATQGETFEELLENLSEAVEGGLSVDVEKPRRKTPGARRRIVEIAVSRSAQARRSDGFWNDTAGCCAAWRRSWRE